MLQLIFYFCIFCTITEFGFMDDDKKGFIWYTPSYFNGLGFNHILSWAISIAIAIVSPFFGIIKIIRWTFQKLGE